MGPGRRYGCDIRGKTFETHEQLRRHMYDRGLVD